MTSPFKLRPRWWLTAGVLFVAVMALISWAFRASLGQWAFHQLPAVWYYNLMEWKHGDPVGGLREPGVLEGFERVVVIVVVGQSNAGNYAPTRTVAIEAGVLVLHRGQLTRARDPMPGSTADGGSPWPAVGDALIRNGAADAVVFVLAVVGGSLASDWEPGGRLHPLLERQMEGLSAAGLAPQVVIWHQGEADAAQGTPAREYQATLGRIVKSLRSSGMDCPVLVARASYEGREPNEPIRAAQLAVTQELSGVLLGPDFDDLRDQWRRDGIHWNDEGAAEVARRWVSVLTPLLGDPVPEIGAE